eukprot:COSAG01_NODE_48198_length_383_cov_0.975352_1_plen_38_part_10
MLIKINVLTWRERSVTPQYCGVTERGELRSRRDGVGVG